MTVENFIEDRQRVNEFNPVSATTNFPLDYPLYGSGDLTDLKNDLIVFLNSAETTNYTIQATFDNGVSTDAQIVFSPGITGNLKVYSARRPQSTAATVQGRGMTAQELSSAFNSALADQRDLYDTALTKRGDAFDADGFIIKNVLASTDPTSAATYGSLQAYASLLPGVAMPPYFQSRTAGQLASIGPGILAVLVFAWLASTPAAPTTYKRVNAQPAHELTFRSADRIMGDGITVDNTNGGWWAADPGIHGLDLRAGGCMSDSDHTGLTGTDDRTAFQRCIDTGFYALRLPPGWTRFDTKIVPRAGQTWIGTGPRAVDIEAGGSGIVYGGSGARSGHAGDANECAMESDPAGDFTNAFWANFSVEAGDNATCTWLLRRWSDNGGNCRCWNVFFKHRNQCLRLSPAQTITSITNANPGVVTYTGADPAEGQRILMSKAFGILELQSREFYATAVNTVAKTFNIIEDTTTYGTFVAGARFTPVDLAFDTYGGDEGGGSPTPSWAGTGFTWAGGKIIPSLIQMRLRTRAGKNWLHWFGRCYFETSADRGRVNQRPGENQDAYLGYNWAIDCASNDVYLNECHVNNACVMGRQNGGIYVTGNDFENVSQGSITTGPDCGRVAIVGRNTGGTPATGGADGCVLRIVGNSFNQHSYAVEANMSYNVGSCDLDLVFTGNVVRRPGVGSCRIIGNTTFGSSGGVFTGNVEISNANSMLCEPTITIEQSWRGSPVDHRAFRIGANIGQIPDEWRRGFSTAPIRWRPKFNTGSAAGDSSAILQEGLACTVVGTPTARTLAITDVQTGYSGPRVEIVSGAGTSSSMFAADHCCWRGDAHRKGGLYLFKRFSLSTLAGTPHGFFGVTNTAAELANVEPSTLTRCFGIGFDTGQTTFHIIRGSSVAGATVDLGSRFPTNVLTNIYDLQIWAASFGATMYLRLRCWNTKAEVVDGLSNAIPAQATLLGPNFWLRDSAAAAVVGFTHYGMDMWPTDDMIGGDI